MVFCAPSSDNDDIFFAKKNNSKKYRRSILVPVEDDEDGKSSSKNVAAAAKKYSDCCFAKKKERRIGYSLVEAKNPKNRRNVIIWFYPFGGSSAILESAARSFYEQPDSKKKNSHYSYYQASVLMVDRPGIGDTDEYNVTRCANNTVNTDYYEEFETLRKEAYKLDSKTGTTASESSSSMPSMTSSLTEYYDDDFSSSSYDESYFSYHSSCNAITGSSLLDAAKEVMSSGRRSSLKKQQQASSSSSSWSSNIDRIQTHARDVIQVLKHHSDEIKNVYIVGACIGHVFAVEFARQLMLLQEEWVKMEDGTETSKFSKFSIRGMALQSPFVSTACSKGWRLARLGAIVPSFVLNFVTHSMSAFYGSSLINMMKTTRSSAEKDLFGQSEGGKDLAKEFGWKTDKNDIDDDDDLEEYCSLLRENHRRMNEYGNDNNNDKMEAQLGVDPSWQVLVCDKFATLYNNKNEDDMKDSRFPITIYGSRHDEIATWESIQWLRDRCFRSSSLQNKSSNEDGEIDSNDNQEENSMVTLVEETRVMNHNLMTSFGGPPRNPVLLHDIVQNWGLLLK